MIDYSLAKQLKDAGFPQDKCSDVSGVNPNHVGRAKYLSSLACPSLSELIEACGTLVLFHNGNEWVAGTGDDKEIGENHIDDSWHQHGKDNGRGASPDIAVAKLWLVLKKSAGHIGKLQGVTIEKDLNPDGSEKVI